MTSLHDLARAVGLQIEWEDANGRSQTVSDENIERVLSALGYEAGSEEEAARSLERHRQETERARFASAVAGQPFAIAEGYAAREAAELTLEGGGTHALTLQRTEDGWRVPPIAEIGYHVLSTDLSPVRLAIGPDRCLDVYDLTGGNRAWGPAVQIPSLRGSAETAFGDYATLAGAAARFAKAGADALAISPTHALFPADPKRYSPYAPSSRLFHNIHLAGSPPRGGEARAGEQADLIAWESAIPRRLEALRAQYRSSRDEVRGAIASFREKKGRELKRHAIFEALHGHFFAQGTWNWREWPEEYRDPASDAVARFAHEHGDEVEFFIFAQWVAAENLAGAQQVAKSSGMAIGLIADLAVGMDPGGSHAWSRQADVLDGLSIGAPPDQLGPDGQDWGLTTFAPLALRRTGFAGFIATIHAALEHAGGIRIDHALGLNRMWVIPQGGSAGDGAYLRYPLEDMLRILAIESHRAGAIVIGEDLGTVPKGLRSKLEAANVLGMRVLPFERDSHGDYAPPSRWQEGAVAMTGTHDLATISGWWSGRDIDWTWKLGRTSPHDSAEAERKAREEERTKLWRALTDSGAARGEQPAMDEPAPVVDATVAHTAMTPCRLAIFPLEDIAGLTEQPNLPGTTDEHPNWRRRMPESVENLLARPEVAQRIETIRGKRR